MKILSILGIVTLGLLIGFIEGKGEIAVKCSRTLVCGVGSCCRDPDGKVIPASFHYLTEVDWWRSQIGINPGNCSDEHAQEGEQCDSFCLCDEGLLCTPNILCKSCGNICMSVEFVNKLVSYYDAGCNCHGSHSGGFGFGGHGPIIRPGISGIPINTYHPPPPPPPPPVPPSYSTDPLQPMQPPPILNGNGNGNGYGSSYGYGYAKSQANKTNGNVKIVNNIVQLPGGST